MPLFMVVLSACFLICWLHQFSFNLLTEEIASFGSQMTLYSGFVDCTNSSGPAFQAFSTATLLNTTLQHVMYIAAALSPLFSVYSHPKVGLTKDALFLSFGLVLMNSIEWKKLHWLTSEKTNELEEIQLKKEQTVCGQLEPWEHTDQWF